MKSNDCGSPSGFVCFSTTMLPRLVFVNVQVTVSPAARSIELGGEPSEHVALVRSQPAGTVVSEAAYVPGLTRPESCGVAASVRLKPWLIWSGPPLSVNGKLCGSPDGAL